MTEDDFIPKVHIDVAMPMGYADDALAGEFALLEPFGTGNPRPLFAQKGLVFQAGFKMGANKTCARFRVKTPEGTTQTVVFLEIWRNWELSWMKNMVLEVERHFMPGKGISHCPWYIRSARIPIRGKRKYSSSCRTIVKFFIF